MVGLRVLKPSPAVGRVTSTQTLLLFQVGEGQSLDQRFEKEIFSLDDVFKLSNQNQGSC